MVDNIGCPGQAKRHPGLRGLIALTPCKGKSILYWIKNKASALTGRHLLTCFDPGCRFACPGLGAFWALLCIIGCTSTIQASLIVFGLHDNSARALSVILNPLLCPIRCRRLFLLPQQTRTTHVHARNSRQSISCCMYPDHV